VVNTRNGKFELVRINDRGPYQEGAVKLMYPIVSPGKIGLIHSGVCQVRLELLQLPEKTLDPEEVGVAYDHDDLRRPSPQQV